MALVMREGGGVEASCGAAQRPGARRVLAYLRLRPETEAGEAFIGQQGKAHPEQDSPAGSRPLCPGCRAERGDAAQAAPYLREGVD